MIYKYEFSYKINNQNKQDIKEAYVFANTKEQATKKMEEYINKENGVLHKKYF